MIYTTKHPGANARGGRGLKRQFDAVYPLIRKKMAGKPYLFDVSDALDGNPLVLIDFCHVTPEGNQAVVKRIAAIASKVGFGPQAKLTPSTAID